MALGTFTAGDQQGQTTMRPNGLLRASIVGDGSTPAGGTTGFAGTYLKAELGRNVEVTQVFGYGYTSGEITHFVRYVDSTDALQVFALAGTEATGDLSAVTFDVVIAYR